MTRFLNPSAFQDDRLSVFEFPCNERIRMMLRLECLGRRLTGLAEMHDRHAHAAAIQSYFELLELFTSRSDVKNELLQELDRQRQRLQRFYDQDGVNQGQLGQVLEDIQASHQALAQVPLRLGPHLPEFDFLQSLKGRSSVPAGLCGFDLPAYQVWLQRPDADRLAMLQSWLAPIRPLLQAASLGLNLLRDSAEPADAQAPLGCYEANPNGRTPKLIRVRHSDARELICEISANKYMVAVRFRALSTDLSLRPIDNTVAFQITLCDL